MPLNLSHREKIFLRILAGLVFVLLSFISPWLIWLSIGFLLLIATKKFPEILIMSFANDLIYGSGTITFAHFRYILTLCAVVLIVAAHFVKRLLRANFRS